MANPCGTEDRVSSATSTTLTRECQKVDQTMEKDGDMNKSKTSNSVQSNRQSSHSPQGESSIHHVTSSNGFDQYSAEQYRRWNQEYTNQQVSGLTTNNQEMPFPACYLPHSSNPEYPHQIPIHTTSEYPIPSTYSYDHNSSYQVEQALIHYFPVPYPVAVPMPVYIDRHIYSHQGSGSRRSSLSSGTHNSSAEAFELDCQSSKSSPKRPKAPSSCPDSPLTPSPRRRRRGRRKKKNNPTAMKNEKRIIQQSSVEGNALLMENHFISALKKTDFGSQSSQISTPGTSLSDESTDD